MEAMQEQDDSNDYGGENEWVNKTKCAENAKI